MKSRIKKLIPIALLSTATALSVLGLTGCSYKYVSDENVYLIYNGILHSGDVYYKQGSFLYTQTTIPSFETDCGKTRSTIDIVVSSEMPEDDEYERVCEECFPVKE